ncbi:GNAT family N-acetyltransferase [Paenibacillus sp. NPDC057967]|uniref:GNAT family N-acetyltransferase n=1 Tax=Paenibacillus sp. NPDC057967 TaxID=3346293 RepID=UPI0036D82FA8
MTIVIRQEQPEDYGITEQVVKSAFADMAFSDQTEHELVARLRQSAEFVPELSLVAVDQEHDEIIGHILLSKIKIVGDDDSVESLSLAPVSVLPEYQGQGIGRQLISESLHQASEHGYSSVVVMGHADYYPKFGFRKASEWGIKAPFEVEDEAFMAMELCEHALERVSGIVEYSGAFFE